MTLFVTAPGVVEALKPIAQQEENKASSPQRKKLVDQLKALTPGELAELLALAASKKAA